MKQEESLATHLYGYIATVLPWVHGHQLQSITAFVEQILDKQTGIQAELARDMDNQEAATKLSRVCCTTSAWSLRL